MSTDTFAARLAAATRAAGISDRRLALLAGLHRSALGHYRAGRNALPTTETAIRLSSVLGCDLRWLLTGVGRAPTKKVARAAVAAAEQRRSEAKTEAA